MNDNILTEHPKLAVEYCLRLRKLGLAIPVEKGQWYYYVGPNTIPTLHIDRDALKFNSEIVPIPTFDQLLDFVQAQAEKVFKGRRLLALRFDLDCNGSGQCDASIICEFQDKMLCDGPTCDSKILALYKLLIKIEEHRKVEK